MPNLKIKTANEEDMSANPDLVHACDSLSSVLQPLDPRIEISALISMMCGCAVLYGLDKEAVLQAIDEGYDAFMLVLSDGGPMQ